MIVPWVWKKGHSTALEEMLEGYAKGEYDEQTTPLINREYRGWFSFTVERWSDMKGEEWKNPRKVLRKINRVRSFHHWTRNIR